MIAHPQLHCALLQTPSGLKHVKPELQSVALLHFAPTAPVVGAAQAPFTHVFGFWHGEEALQVHPVHLKTLVSKFQKPKKEGSNPQLQSAVLQTPSGAKHVMSELQFVESLHFAPSPPPDGEADGFGEAEVCIFVGAGVVGAAPAFVGHTAPSAAYFVLTRPVSCHSTPLITSFLLPLGFPWMFEKASIMMSIDPGD
jgi:hypothetical protein